MDKNALDHHDPMFLIQVFFHISLRRKSDLGGFSTGIEIYVPYVLLKTRMFVLFNHFSYDLLSLFVY